MLRTPFALHPADIAAWIPGFSWGTWLPYLTGALVLVIGLITVRNQFLQKQGLDKIVVLGPVFFAVPLAVFGTEHFTAATILAGMVPAWLPAHLGFAYFTGLGHIAAGIGIIVAIVPRLAATLEAIMMSLFGLLVWVPSFLAHPRPAWATPPQTQWSELVINLMLAAAAWVVAASFRARA